METEKQQPSSPVGPLDEDNNEDSSTTTSSTSNVFDKIMNGKFSFHFPDLDRFCYSGVVIDDAAVEGQKTIESGAEALPDTAKEFVEDHADIFHSKSEVVQTKVRDGWAISMEALANVPVVVSGYWNDAAEKYHENNKKQNNEAAPDDEPPVRSELALQ